MTVQFSAAVRNAMLDAVEVAIGASPKLRFYSGAMPANCAAAATGSLLLEMALPSNFYDDAAGGSKALAGTWSGQASGAGTIGYYRILNAAGDTCHEQGTVTVAGGGGAMIIDNATVSATQTVTVSAKTLTAGNA